MNKAAVFSQSIPVSVARPIKRSDVEAVLKKFLLSIGQPLSNNGVILGHIKLLAKLAASEDYIFLSLTRMDRVDVKTMSEDAVVDAGSLIRELVLELNVLVFGHSKEAVMKVVQKSLADAEFKAHNLFRP
ncbi:MAG: hypothetical protein H6Q73_278 [Firmicutes bacterium]|nr:hypothetical protein [Bacillota bacterium]